MPITPVSFEEDQPQDDAQYDEGQYDEIVDEVVDNESEVQQVMTIDSRMAEMEERLEMIQYYKLLLNGGFFNSPPNQVVAEKIEKEVAEFVLSRLDSLLNMGSKTPGKTQVESQFTDEEVQNLKSLAAPDTHKILTDVVSKVFARIESNTAKKPAKAEPPKLATKTVPEAPAPKKAAPAPMTVKARTMTNRAPTAPAKPQPQPKQEQQPVQAQASTPARPGPQKKKFKEVAKVNQKTGEIEGTAQVEVTPQARPLGPIQPLPVATSKQELEMQMEMSARRTGNMGLNIFDQKLSQ